MATLDLIVFVAFVVTVISVGLWKSRDEAGGIENDAQDYFLAGRGLTWPLVGFSLIAANISTEQFVGMSGASADWLGMAIASYEWFAAVSLSLVAFIFLPRFLKSGIYTIPEFLEYRYTTAARMLMAVFMMITLVGVPTAAVIYSGAKVITVFFQGQSLLGFDLGNITTGCWIIGTLAAIYVFAGGLKACAWADLIQGAALIVGGTIVGYFVLQALGSADPKELITSARNQTATVEALAEQGPIERFFALNEGPLPDGKLHMKRPFDDKAIPWTTLLLGLWIPNLYYWGLNQYITQRTLGSKSLAEGQKGIVFAAFLKLIIPFIVVIPGILAFNLYRGDLRNAAVVKNAKTIATFAPDLYRSLSDAVKPASDNPLFRNDLQTIEKQLNRSTELKGRYVFGFTPEFAIEHPEDARRIVEFNLEQFSQEELPEGNSQTEINKLLLADIASNKLSATEHKLVLEDYDAAFPVLLRNLLSGKSGILGFVMAAIFGAVVSSLASMLNSASTIASMDLYRKARPAATSFELVTVGRTCVVLFVIIAMSVAPSLDNPKFGGIFNFIQEFQGFVSPGVLSIFLFAMFVPRAPRACGIVGLLVGPATYCLLKFGPLVPALRSIPGFLWMSDRPFLDRMSITFGVVVFVLTLMTLIRPLQVPATFPVNEKMKLEGSPTAKVAAFVVVGLTAWLYYYFW